MKIAIYIVMIILFLLIAFAGWKLDRWINWKFDYGRRVDVRIDKLEKRIELLEKWQAIETGYFDWSYIDVNAVQLRLSQMAEEQ